MKIIIIIRLITALIVIACLISIPTSKGTLLPTSATAAKTQIEGD